MTLREQFLAEIDAFMRRHEMGPSAFGLAARNDGSFVTRLRTGESDPKSSTIDDVRAWMAERDKALGRKTARPKRAAAQAAA
jgi:hypothetical protein